NVCGNVNESYGREEIDSQLKSELLTALQPAFARISELGVRYSAIPGHTAELSDALNEILSKKWAELRGLQVVSFGVNSVKASEEDENMIKQLQRAAVMKDPTMAAATLVGAQASAMEAAAANEGGAMMGFMGLGMANQAGGGMNAQNLFAMGQQNLQNQQNQPGAGQQAAPSPNAWQLFCGKRAARCAYSTGILKRSDRRKKEVGKERFSCHIALN
ncbi:MAG: SPFH domain-containing protein, partial [Oscillospiraceae bacterium]